MGTPTGQAVHELGAPPLGRDGAAMRRNAHTRAKALRLAPDSVARYAQKHEPEADPADPAGVGQGKYAEDDDCSQAGVGADDPAAEVFA
jgi:hypothetical protein